MKGVIQIAIEVDYEKVLLEEDLEVLKRFAGANNESEIVKYHLDGLTRHLTQVVSKFDFADYYIESDIYTEQQDNNDALEDSVAEIENEEVDSIDVNQEEENNDENEYEYEYEEDDDDLEEDIEESDNPALWVEDLENRFIKSYEHASDKGSIMKLIVNNRLEDSMEEVLENNNLVELDRYSEAMDELYGIVVDPTDPIDLEEDEFLVIYQNLDGTEHAQVWNY